MAGKISVEMTEAKRLVIECGLTAYEAAKRAGVKRAGIYMSPWYKDYMSKARGSECQSEKAARDADTAMK